MPERAREGIYEMLISINRYIHTLMFLSIWRIIIAEIDILSCIDRRE